jgi:hypothetical protein
MKFNVNDRVVPNNFVDSQWYGRPATVVQKADGTDEYGLEFDNSPHQTCWFREDELNILEDNDNTEDNSEEKSDQKSELESFKDKVKEVALRVKEEQVWCDESFYQTMEGLGFTDMKPKKYEVNVRLSDDYSSPPDIIQIVTALANGDFVMPRAHRLVVTEVEE